MKLSIVTTLYRSAADLPEFYKRTIAAAEAAAGSNFELILVNDGSPDDSIAVARDLAADDARIIIVDLSRNFGQHAALWTGMQQAQGDFVFTLDSDLEEAPEWLPEFWAKRDDEDVDVVYGVQAKRRGNEFDRVAGEAFYWTFRKLTQVAIPSNVTNARLMTQRYVDALLSHSEREIFLAALWEITGFRQLAMPVEKLSLSPTTYSLRAKLALMIGSIVTFSSAPLVGIFYVGLLVLATSILASLYLAANWMMGASPPAGWTSVLISVWLLGGLIISFIGVIGIYIHKIFSETKQRPVAIIRSIEGRHRS